MRGGYLKYLEFHWQRVEWKNEICWKERAKENKNERRKKEREKERKKERKKERSELSRNCSGIETVLPAFREKSRQSQGRI